MKKTFQDQVVLVTGGGRGIGKIIAHEFGKEGACVVICDINEEIATQTKNEFTKKNIESKLIILDLSKKGAAQKLIDQVKQEYGKINVLINNARSGTKTTLLTENEETWDLGMSVTLKAAFFVSQKAIKLMSQTGGGSIINISSIEAMLSGIDSPSYQIAKAGMLQMTRYLAVNAGEYKIRVNAILPGFIVQDEYQRKYLASDNVQYRKIAEFCHPGGETGKSIDIAEMTLFLCTHAARFITGQMITIDGGLSVQEQSGLVYRYSKEFV